MSFAVAMQNVSFGYDAQAPIIRIKELYVETGRRIFIHGASGSGKTTLLGLIAGILHPQRGSCEVLGKDLAQLTLFARDRHRGAEMGCIVQSSDLIPYLSVRENIELPCRVHEKRRKRITLPTLEEEVVRIAARLDLLDVLDDRVDGLNEVQQQRVVIARAVIGSPSLVTADARPFAETLGAPSQLLEILIDLCNEARATLICVGADRSLMSLFEGRIDISEINQVLA